MPDWDSSFVTWPKQGGMRSGECFRRPNAERRTGGSASSSLPTADWQTPATDSFRSRGGDRKGEMGLDQQARWLTPHGMAGIDRTGKRGQGGEFAKQATRWPTPRAAENGNDSGSKQRQKQGPNPGLKDAAKNWTLPHAQTNRDDGTSGTDGMSASMPKDSPTSEGESRNVTKKNWPTPNAHDGRRPGNEQGSTQGANLKRDAEMFPTPASRDVKGANSAKHCLVTGRGRKHMDQLANFVSHSGLPAPETPPVGQASSPYIPNSLRRLNPRFVEWMMNLPPGWTDFAPLGKTNFVRWEIQSRLCVRRLLSRP